MRVLEYAAIGIPDGRSGEAVELFVVRKAPLSEESLVAYCREDFTEYKKPKMIEFRDELPKVQRRQEFLQQKRKAPSLL